MLNSPATPQKRSASSMMYANPAANPATNPADNPAANPAVCQPCCQPCFAPAAAVALLQPCTYVSNPTAKATPSYPHRLFVSYPHPLI